LDSPVTRDRFDRKQPIELGHEPALRVNGEVNEVQISTPVNLRWLSGTLLTGLVGIALISGSIFTAMKGEARLAVPPEALQLRSGASALNSTGSANNLRKGDRIAVASATADIRQTLRLSSVYRTGDREVVRSRPVVRLSVALTQTKDDDLDFPGFNPSAIFSGTGQAAEPESDVLFDMDASGDVSYVTRPLNDLTESVLNGPELPLAQVLQRVKEMATLESVMNNANQSDLTNSEPGSLPLTAASSSNDAFGFDPQPRLQNNRVRPHNVSVIAKTTDEAKLNSSKETNIPVGPNDRLETILGKKGVNPQDIRQIASALGADSGYGNVGLQNGQTIALLMPGHPATPNKPLRVIIRSGLDIAAQIALTDDQHYVRIEAHDVLDTDENSPTAQNLLPRTTQSNGKEIATLYDSLYTTTLWQNVPRDVIQELVRIFGHDEDLQRRVISSDSLDVLYAEHEDGKIESPQEILYAALNSGGETHRYYYFQPPGDSIGDYFDNSGRSARKFLINKPVASGILRSGFGSRRHPILGYTKMHTGVDWAAARGTPIFAAGDGIIESAGWSNGYGRAIRIRHANAHETLYGHMSAFARDIKEGMSVKQGQTIGYIGSTGLSTGPHLHFEIRINGRLQDPMRLRVPKQEELHGEVLAQFQRERERLDALMGRSISADKRTTDDTAEYADRGGKT
jgi:murein DD-endopeptidase MepM/ murein hydrolase activator NlpD